jgi:hypothetical protein
MRGGKKFSRAGSSLRKNYKLHDHEPHESKNFFRFRDLGKTVSDEATTDGASADFSRAERISRRVQKQITLLFSFILPVLCIALTARFFTADVERAIIESDLLILLNVLGWICLVSALAASQEAVALGTPRTWAPRLEAFLGASLKLLALTWLLIRALESGERFAFVFAATLAGYLFFTAVLVSIGSRISSGFSPPVGPPVPDALPAAEPAPPGQVQTPGAGLHAREE